MRNAIRSYLSSHQTTWFYPVCLCIPHLFLLVSPWLSLSIVREIQKTSWLTNIFSSFVSYFPSSPDNGLSSDTLSNVQEPYILALQDFVEINHGMARFEDIMMQLPELKSCTKLLLQSKLLYMPYLLNAVAMAKS